MEPTKFYHIYNRANGDESLFRSDENFRFFLQRYGYFISDVADTYAYCLMPNHIHFLVKIKSAIDIEATFGKFETSQKLEARISKQWANLFSSYTQALNKMYSRKGSLFIPNFKRKEISNEFYFRNVIHYIHANPIHHGFAKKLTDWTWSSFHSMLLEIPTKLKRKEVLDWFGNSNEYVKYHEQPIDQKLLLELAF